MRRVRHLWPRVAAGLVLCALLTGLAPVSFTRSPEEERRQKAAQEFLQAHRDFTAPGQDDARKAEALERATAAADILFRHQDKHGPILLMAHAGAERCYTVYSLQGSALFADGYLWTVIPEETAAVQIMPGFFYETANPAADFHVYLDIKKMLAGSPDGFERLMALWALQKMGWRSLDALPLMAGIISAQIEQKTMPSERVLKAVQDIVSSARLHYHYELMIRGARQKFLHDQAVLSSL